MNPELWQTLSLSLGIAAVATVVALAISLPLAHFNARHLYWGKSIVEGLIVVPMVLPPTVVGYIIIVALGARGWLGQYFRAWFDYSILFRPEGAVIAGAVVALPLLYLPTRAALAAVDRDMEDVARVMGASRPQLFLHVTLPLAFRGLLSGLMLAFARALGEFGATVMVFGIRENHMTLPVSIYVDYEQGDMQQAAPAVGILCVLSLTITLLYNRSTLSRQQ